MTRSLVVLSLVFGAASLLPSTAVADEATGTIVVDDDNVQCPDAEISTIQKAVDKAAKKNSDRTAENDVQLIRVCPGLYTESVTVKEPLTLMADPAAVKAADPPPADPLAAVKAVCFEPNLPALTADQYAIVDPPDSTVPAFALRAGAVDLSGFVIHGQSIGIRTSEGFSGYHVHHNLIAENRVGIKFDSGTLETSPQLSRFDDNCLRENAWGLAVERGLVNARIDHNASFMTAERAFETALGPVENVTLEHNHSRLDKKNAYLIWQSTGSSIVDNTIESVPVGIQMGSELPQLDVGLPNRDLVVSGNVLVNPYGVVSTGIAFAANASGSRSTRVDVVNNTITGHRTGIAIGGPPGTDVTTGSLTDSDFVGNVTSNNGQRGIRLRALNEKLTFSGNVANNNGLYGIDSQCGLVAGELTCPTANHFEANYMFGNGTKDARDQAREWNTWIDNHCLTDEPAGTICGIGLPAE